MTNQLLSIQRNHFVRVLLIGCIILLLQIPIAMLFAVISERQASRDEAAADVTEKWGQNQALVGPVLVVPFTQLVTEKINDDKTRTKLVTKQAVFLPEALEVKAEVTSETRYRGIYEVPVYRADVQVAGHFADLDFSGWDVEDSDILWDKATVSVLVSDVRSLVSASSLRWGGQSLELEPGARVGKGSGIHAKVSKEQLAGPTTEFSLDLGLNGSQQFSVAPVGSQTLFAVKSNWPHPSFQGTWLPERKAVVTAEGFEASWAVNLLGRNYPQRWVGLGEHQDTMVYSVMAVRFMPDIDQYRMAFRSVKYEILFLVLVFMTLWLFEVLSGLQIHAIQYVFVGVAMCLFYLLELSLAEHIGFVAAYALAASMVCGLVVGYCRAVLRTRGRATVVGAVLALLYCYLYMLLINQGFALLAGSLGLFGALSLVMYLTRNVDWNNLALSQGKPGTEDAPAAD